MLTDKTFGQISQRWPVKYLCSIHVDKTICFCFRHPWNGYQNSLSSKTTFGCTSRYQIRTVQYFYLTKMACYGIHWPGVKHNPSSLWYLFDREFSVQPKMPEFDPPRPFDGYCHFIMPKTNCIFILWRPIKFDTPWVTAIALERDDTKRNYINGEIKCEWLGVELL